MGGCSIIRKKKLRKTEYSSIMLYLGCPNMSITRHVILKIANSLVNYDITMKDNKVKNCLLFIIDSFIIVKKCERSVCGRG